MIWPDFKDWRTWTIIVGCIGAYISISKAAEPFYYVSSGYLKEATQPILVVALQNTLATIKGEQQTIKTRMQMALTRLAAAPTDSIALDALNAAQEDMDDAEFRKQDALCALRRSQALGCYEGPPK